MGMKAKILKELKKKPRSLKELKGKLGSDKKVARAAEELTRRGKAVCRDGVYALPGGRSQRTVTCELVKLTGRFGFARPGEGDGPDIFLPGKHLHGAMPGDTVLVALSEHPRDEASPEGEVLAVLHENNSFIGTVAELDGRLALAPDACPERLLLIRKSAAGGAQPGEKAAVELLSRGETYEEHRAGVAMRFGSAEDARHCVKALLYGAGMSRHFPLKVKNEAKQYENASVSREQTEGRADFRALPVFTMDAAETKDIDDAVSIEPISGGWRLGVHIADVSEYVRPGSALDAEAMARGTSVYYADSVIPMLPRQLSNGVCSLNEGEDRLAFSCLLELDETGRVQKSSFVKSVICSRVKGVYSEINALLDGTADDAVRGRYAPVARSLEQMHALYEKLLRLRAERGAMEIESGEARLTLDEAGACIGVARRTRGEAERMIEEFMLLANTAAASLARGRALPFVYRVHEAPDPERIAGLRAALTAAGVECRFSGETPTVRELARLLDETRGTPLERMVHASVLRSMAKAKYGPKPEGHFGLALPDYAHFTSPIRRYPDLAIHRILTEACAGADGETLRGRYGRFAAEAAKRASEREVLAMTVERGAEDCYKAEYMRRFVGAADGVFEGVISSVMQFGVYVELPNTVEGLMRAAALSERPLVLTEGVALRDPPTGRVWRVGDTVRVRVAGVDVAHGHVDFVPAEEPPAEEGAALE